jgi:Asp-tRNA(Asn)/Glu-tRNA(Gln) amidotransferase A subunit family amidase
MNAPSSGMPLSVQLVGLPAQDGLVLQLAGQMERSGMVLDRAVGFDRVFDDGKLVKRYD